MSWGENETVRMLVKAGCNACGYETQVHVSVGPYVDDDVPYDWPYACLSCANVVTADLKAVQPRCPDCRSFSLIPYERAKIDSASTRSNDLKDAHASLRKDKLHCPRCGKAELHFEDLCVHG